MAELGEMTRDVLIAGDYPVKAETITITGPAEFMRGDVVGVTSDGAYALVDSSKSDGTQNPIGVMCDAVTVPEGETAVATMYIKGEFAIRGLRFSGTDTAEKHRRRMTEIGLLVRETKAEGGAY